LQLVICTTRDQPMKTFVPFYKYIVGIRPGFLIIISFLAIIHSSSLASPGVRFTTLYGDSIVIQKQFSNKKHNIRLYPNANQEVLFFSARGEAGRVYQLFLFDIDGKLVKQANIKNNQTTVLNKIEKGNYLFEIFSDDERIENGQVIVR